MKYRILVFAMTFRRDFGSCYILSKLFEKFGCEAIVACNENYVSKSMLMWNPHAIVLTSTRRVQLVRRAYPNALIFVYEGESTDIGLVKYELEIVGDPIYYNNIERCYLRGNSMFELLEAEVAKMKGESVVVKSNVSLSEKFLVVGNPHLDVIKYHKVKEKSPGLRVGLVGHFHRINNISSENVFKRILDHAAEDLTDYKWEERWDIDLNDTEAQIKLLRFYCELIEHFRSIPDSFFSIRPYPNENIKYYFDNDYFKKNNVDVNTSMEFCSWFQEQDIIIGPTSSTSIQLAAAQKPYINIDMLLQRPKRDFMEDMLPMISKYCPQSISEVYTMIENRDRYQFKADYFDDILKADHNFPFSQSCILRVANDVLLRLSQKKPMTRTLSVPKKAVLGIDRVLKKRKKCKEILNTSYSYFDFDAISVEVAEEFDSVADAIWNAKENAPLLNMGGFDD